MEKKLSVILWATAVLLAACSPKNEEVTDAQVQTGSVPEALDTVSNVRKDALKTAENTTSPTLPMPPSVMQLLAQRYPGWEQPSLTAGALQQAQGHEQGPTLVRGDFNGDLRQDYALQLQQEKNVVIVALLDAGDENWDVQEIKQDILFNERGKLKSLYYLYLVNKGEDLKSAGAGSTEAPHDGFAVGIGNSTTTYLYTDGAYTAYTAE